MRDHFLNAFARMPLVAEIRVRKRMIECLHAVESCKRAAKDPGTTALPGAVAHRGTIVISEQSC